MTHYLQSLKKSYKSWQDIRNDVALIVADDAQIATILSKKRQNDKPFYTVMIESENS